MIAQRNLGDMYANGIQDVLDKDEDQAKSWWKKAADQGDGEATRDLQSRGLTP
jgi:TPR repeat protein